MRITIRELPLEDSWADGHTCTLLATGEQGLILESRIIQVEDGHVREYHVHFDDRIENRRQWFWERDLLMTGLTYTEQGNLFWHLKGLNMDDDAAALVMERHGCTPGKDTERAFYLLHGMTTDTAAEMQQVQASAEAAMRAGRYDCL
jgi:hypothetical protein